MLLLPEYLSQYWDSWISREYCRPLIALRLCFTFDDNVRTSTERIDGESSYDVHENSWIEVLINPLTKINICSFKNGISFQLL